HQPQDNRFLLLAAQCFFELGAHPGALAMYGLSLANDASPAALSRIGDCFLALGQDEHAIRAFDAALESSTTDAQHQEMEEHCARNVRLLRRKLSGWGA